MHLQLKTAMAFFTQGKNSIIKLKTTMDKKYLTFSCTQYYSMSISSWVGDLVREYMCKRTSEFVN